MPLYKGEEILDSRLYDDTKDNYIWIFGYTGRVIGEASISVLKALLKLGHNTFALNWEQEASSTFVPTNTPLDPYAKSFSYVVSGLPEAFRVSLLFSII